MKEFLPYLLRVPIYVYTYRTSAVTTQSSRDEVTPSSLDNGRSLQANFKKTSKSLYYNLSEFYLTTVISYLKKQ